MLIIEHGQIIDEVDIVSHRKIGNHDVIYFQSDYSFHWYALIALSLIINLSNLIYFHDFLGIHSYLLMGLFLLFFKAFLVDTFLADRTYYEVIDEDEDCLYVEYSDVNDFEYLYDLKPRFELFTMIKVLMHYLMYVGFSILFVHLDFNQWIIAILLTSALFVSSYLTFDYDYSDFHFYLNFSLCCMAPMVLILFGVYYNWMVVLLWYFIFVMMVYCIANSKNKGLLKIILLCICFFFIFQLTHSFIQPYQTYRIENGALY